MRPTPFSIEIPDRPVYKPGSGPAMAPITLQPDNSDTGWVIAGTVDFQGISQYVVTPKDNPAHRRPVKKQHILDWVSPKAHEDFEYAQYKIQTEAEQDREEYIHAKAASVKQRRQGLGLARERAKARKPFARYMQLEQVEESDRGSTSGHLSSPEHSPDELNRDILPRRVEPTKRKHSVEFRHHEEPAVKRRGLSGSSKASLVWKAQKPTPFKPRQQNQVETTGSETGVDDEAEAIPEPNSARLKRPNTLDRPILPPQKRLSSDPRTLIRSKSSVSQYSAPTSFVPAVASPSWVLPKLHWSVVYHPVHVPQSASPPSPSKATYPRKVTSAQPPNHGKVYPPILPPTAQWKPPASKPISTPSHIAANGVEESVRRRRHKRQHHSLSPTEESVAVIETSETNNKSVCHGSDPAYDKKVMGRSQFSDIAFSRDTRTSTEPEARKQKKGKGRRSSSSDSSNVLRWPSKQENTKVSNEQSKYFASVKMKNKNSEDIDGDEGESEEIWHIHGILDDELRRVNGQLVRHYLCDWVGDYDPTWEPEENVSTDSIKRYEKKKRRINLSFDGAADIDMMSGNSEASDRNTLGRLDNILQQENEASDSEYLTDALTEAAIFLTPGEIPRSRSSTGSVAGEGEVVGAESL